MEQTVVFIVLGSKKTETLLTILPYRGMKMYWQGMEYTIKDVIVYADLNQVHVFL